MTLETITITFDEKFDLEEGELKLITADIDYYYVDFENSSYSINDEEYLGDGDAEVTIDNTGDVTVLTLSEIYNLNNVGEYWQFQYWVDNEFVKATKHIPMLELVDNHTSEVSININDVEIIFCGLNSEPNGGGFSRRTEEIDDQMVYDNYHMTPSALYISDATELPGYTSVDDYDFSDVLVRIYYGCTSIDNISDDTLSFVIRYGDKDEELDMRDFDPDFYLGSDDGEPGFCYEIVTPGIKSNIAYSQYNP